MAAILPKGTKHTGTIGGSPRGWTFLSSAKCWRMWAMRYLVGFFPLIIKDYFDLGQAFHAVMEGQPPEKVAQDHPENYTEAMRLAAVRRAGPPLGRATAVEQEYVLFGGKMTSKPDREETDSRAVVTPGTSLKPNRIRDYKSTFNFSEHDDATWGVDPGILGEIIAAQVDHGIVDIVTKREGKGENGAPVKSVKLVHVQLTDAKHEALRRLVDDFWEQLERRVTAVAKAEQSPSKAFPPQLTACVGKYGPCEYYARCWGKPPESLLYKLAPEPPRRWVTGREDAPLKLPGKLTKKLVETAARIARAEWFGPGGRL